MPKVVNHEKRRAEIAAAVWRVVERAGVDGATVRAVADEAGWSMGALRYYFASQAELFRFAIDTLLERVPARLDAHRAAELAPRERARRLLLELVPVDDQRRAEALVWLAFLQYSRTDPALGHIRGVTWEGGRDLCREVVTVLLGQSAARPAGGPLRPATLEHEAQALHTFADGITLQVISWPEAWTPRTMLAATDRQLDGIVRRHAPGV